MQFAMRANSMRRTVGEASKEQTTAGYCILSRSRKHVVDCLPPWKAWRYI